MTKMQPGQVFPQLIPFEGRYLILKLQRKQETDEDRTLESPGVRQEITDYLINSRKQLLAASYQAMAMNEAKVENFLAKKVVENPNELSGARPAPAANSNTNPAANSAPAANMNTAPASSANAANGAGNAASNAKPASNANAPARNANAPAASKRRTVTGWFDRGVRRATRNLTSSLQNQVADTRLSATFFMLFSSFRC
jgi:hypothetical protein